MKVSTNTLRHNGDLLGVIVAYTLLSIIIRPEKDILYTDLISTVQVRNIQSSNFSEAYTYNVHIMRK